MSCTHAQSCPLHPYLRGSLSAWRTRFCDTGGAYVDCARFQKGLSGQPIPLALLPNGKMVQALETGMPSALPSTGRPTAASNGRAAVGSVARPSEPTQRTDVISDQVATSVLVAARDAKPGGLWKRFTNLFGVSK